MSIWPFSASPTSARKIWPKPLEVTSQNFSSLGKSFSQIICVIIMWQKRTAKMLITLVWKVWRQKATKSELCCVKPMLFLCTKRAIVKLKWFCWSLIVDLIISFQRYFGRGQAVGSSVLVAPLPHRSQHHPRWRVDLQDYSSPQRSGKERRLRDNLRLVTKSRPVESVSFEFYIIFSNWLAWWAGEIQED